jgi:hypothetical protein
MGYSRPRGVPLGPPDGRIGAKVRAGLQIHAKLELGAAAQRPPPQRRHGRAASQPCLTHHAAISGLREAQNSSTAAI